MSALRFALILTLTIAVGCRSPAREAAAPPADTGAPALAYLTAFAGQYPADAGVWQSEPLRTRMVRLLGGDFEPFLENIKTSGPISVEDGLIYVMGNCPSSAKIWGAGIVVVDPGGNRILIKHSSDAWDSVRTSSDGDIATLPKDVMTMLRNWADRPPVRPRKPGTQGTDAKG
jgi:hypothetical protein